MSESAAVAATATWAWRLLGPVAEQVEFLRRRRVSAAFVSVGWAGVDPSHRELARALRGAGLRCEALGGDPSWARSTDLASQWAERAVASGLFDGIHLDVEPWTLPEWSRESSDLFNGLVATVERIATLAAVDVDLPAWLARDHPAATRDAIHAAHRVTILAYRDRAPAIAEDSSAARAVAEQAGRGYRVAVDTLPSSSPGTTFADDGAAVLERELKALNDRLAGGAGYGGVAVHDLTGWRALTG